MPTAVFFIPAEENTERAVTSIIGDLRILCALCGQKRVLNSAIQLAWKLTADG